MDLHYLLYSAVLAWVMVLVASLVRSKAWAPAGMRVAFGNRDDTSEASPLSGRLDRASRNMLENLVLFTTVLLAARAMQADAATLADAAALFFWSRVAYWGVYAAGIPYLRTLVWAVSVWAMGTIAWAALTV